MSSQPYPLRIPANVLEAARIRAKMEYVDQSTALRQFLHMGAEEYVVRLVESGRISIGKGAQLLSATIWDMHDIAARHGLRLGARASDIEDPSRTAKLAAELMQGRPLVAREPPGPYGLMRSRPQRRSRNQRRRR